MTLFENAIEQPKLLSVLQDDYELVALYYRAGQIAFWEALLGFSLAARSGQETGIARYTSSPTRTRKPGLWTQLGLQLDSTALDYVELLCN